jgi:hypothetical protein
MDKRQSVSNPRFQLQPAARIQDPIPDPGHFQPTSFLHKLYVLHVLWICFGCQTVNRKLSECSDWAKIEMMAITTNSLKARDENMHTHTHNTNTKVFTFFFFGSLVKFNFQIADFHNLITFRISGEMGIV